MEAVRVDRLARPDHPRPPTRLAGLRVRAGEMLVAGQRVADEDRVRFVGREFAVRLVSDLDRAQSLPAVERERCGERQALVARKRDG